MTTDIPPIHWIYYDCDGSVGRQGSDGPPSTWPTVPAGCTEITKEEYEARASQLRAEVAEAKAALVAADEEAAAAAAQEAAAMPLVAGPVTDDNFPGPRAPIDGSMAVDTESGRLYVRVAGEWKSSALG